MRGGESGELEGSLSFCVNPESGNHSGVMDIAAMWQVDR